MIMSVGMAWIGLVPSSMQASSVNEMPMLCEVYSFDVNNHKFSTLYKYINYTVELSILCIYVGLLAVA